MNFKQLRNINNFYILLPANHIFKDNLTQQSKLLLQQTQLIIHFQQTIEIGMST